MRHLAYVLIVSGVCLVVGGFLYDVRFAGIPYQDPTPQMQAQYEHHARIASTIMKIGIFPLVVGLVGVSFLSVLKKKEPNQAPEPTGPSARGSS